MEKKKEENWTKINNFAMMGKSFLFIFCIFASFFPYLFFTLCGWVSYTRWFVCTLLSTITGDLFVHCENGYALQSAISKI